MIITNLNYAEKIVNTFEDLYWEGWDIICITKNQDAYTSKHGVFINNSWAIKKRYSVGRNGWNIPNKYKVVK